MGTWQLQGEACERIVAAALDMGYRHVDTAEGYGNERAVGRALKRVDREDLFVTTKVWREHIRLPALRRRCERSLRSLNTDYVDLYLVHWPDSRVPAAATVEGMETLREEGKIRAWGVSNYTVAHLEEMLRHGTPATNQVELHPRFPQPDLERWCAARGIPLTAYSPLGSGSALGDPVLQEIAGKHGSSVAQVALAWVLARGHLTIPRTGSERHLADNIAAAGQELDADDMAYIASLPRAERMFDFEWSEFDRS